MVLWRCIMRKNTARDGAPLSYSLMRDKQELICASTFNFPTLGNQEISVVWELKATRPAS